VLTIVLHLILIKYEIALTWFATVTVECTIFIHTG